MTAKKIPSGGGVAESRGGFYKVWKNLSRHRACRSACQPVKNLLCRRRFGNQMMKKAF
jgi:hypothetical protein